jgi:hypothetical protein
MILPATTLPTLLDNARGLDWRRAGVFAALISAGTLHVVGLLSLHFGYLDPLFSDTETHIGQGSDFFAVHSAGHNFLHGDSVYAAYEGSGVPYAYPFRYLPSTGFSLGALLSLLPPWVAYWGWVVLSECLLLFNVALTWRLAPSQSSRVIGTVMWLLFTPFYVELFVGQFSFVMGSVMFWLGLSLVAGDRRRVFATWLASLLLKANSLILLPVAWRTGWLREAALGIVVVAALNLPYFLLAPGSWTVWSANFDFASGRSIADPHAGNLGLSSVQSLLRADLHGPLADVALQWGPAVVIASLAATALSNRRRVVPLIALWTCVYFLVHDEVWEHHYTMLLPVLVLLVIFEPQLRRAAVLTYVLIALPTPYALFQSAPAPEPRVWFFDAQQDWSQLEVYAYHLAKVLPVLALWGVLSWTLARGDAASVTTSAKLTARRWQTQLRERLRATAT